MSLESDSCRLLITQRALNDIDEIYEYSIQTWDEDVAERYLDDIQAALSRIKSHPGLLRQRPDFSKHLKFYVVNRHLIVCDQYKETVVVLTISNARLDLIEKLKSLEPILAEEIELLRGGMTE